MSKNTQNTETAVEAVDPTTKKVDMVTFVNFMAEFASDGQEPITILENENEDGSISVDINDDFMEMFTTAFPEADLQVTLQDMIEMIVLDYIDKDGEIKETPEVKAVEDNDEVNDEDIPLA